MARFSLLPNYQTSFHFKKLGYAVQEAWRDGYTFSHLRSDILSGIVVGLIAIPLAMALAIASGVSPEHGLFTVIIGGAVVAALGGSRSQVTGPTAAFVVILAPITAKFGLAGLLVAGLMAGLLLILMGISGMGKLIQYIPHPVTTGFTAGIAVVIFTIQLKDFLGLAIPITPETFFERVGLLVEYFPTFSWAETSVAILTFTGLIMWPKINNKIPSPIVVLISVSVFVYWLRYFFPELKIQNIGDRFQNFHPGGFGIPLPILPWTAWDSAVKPFELTLSNIHSLFPSAIAIAMLGAIESLLSAVVADGIAQTKHDPDSELVALGIGNVVCPFFGAIAATGAIARTAANIRFGARSPIAAIVHSIFVLLVVIFFSPYVAQLPMAALSALLAMIAFNMSDSKHFIHIIKVAPRSDVLVMLSCFLLTVAFDMVIGVTFGVIFASMILIRRLNDLTVGRTLPDSDITHAVSSFSKNFVCYEIAGPLLFGAAERAVGALHTTTDHMKGVVFFMNLVPVMDMTGLVAFQTVMSKLQKRGKAIVLVGLCHQPFELLKKANIITGENSSIFICDTIDEAKRLTETLLSEAPTAETLRSSKMWTKSLN